MKKVLTIIALAATLGVTAVATSSPADAWWRGGWGGGWRGGWGWRGPGPWVAGALVGGAVVGAAVASRPYYYNGYYNNGYYPYGPAPYYGGCRRVWNGYYWTRACY